MTTFCPKCGKEDSIQKVSSIVLSGHSSGTFSGPSAGVSYVGGKFGTTGGYATLSGSTTTALAQLLAPPPKPMYSSPSKLYTTLGIFGIVAGLILAGMGPSILGFPGYIFSAIWIVIGFFAFRQSSRESAKYPTEYAKQLKDWEIAMSQWNSLYYCYRDDLVFDPVSGKTVQPQYISTWLNT